MNQHPWSNRRPAPNGEAVEELDPPNIPEQAAAEGAATLAWIRQQIGAAQPIPGTPGEQYLVEHRELRPPWPLSLLWSEEFQITPHAPPCPCLIAVVTNQAGEIVAVQSTEIDLHTATKTGTPRSRSVSISEGAVSSGSIKAGSRRSLTPQ
jgi:hypothetical protein